jgi:D-alanyl-D-alanine dipeptidase
MLRRIPNLRRIAVTPVADVPRCAEQIGTDYIFSWRPNPSQMICCGFDPELIRRVVRDAMEASRGCHVDITLKDVQTVQGKPENLREWVEVVREVSDAYA